MDRIFRTSGLMREKWDKFRGQYTYGQKTIEQAISHCVDVYEPKAVSNDTDIALAFFGKGEKNFTGTKKFGTERIFSTGTQMSCTAWRNLDILQVAMLQ